MTIATTVAIKQFIRPNWSNFFGFVLIGLNIRYWKRRITVNDTFKVDVDMKHMNHAMQATSKILVDVKGLNRISYDKPDQRF